jgi:hypothetical protein
MTNDSVTRALDEITGSPSAEYAYALLYTYVLRCHGEFPANAFRYLWFHENAPAAKELIGAEVVSEIDAAVLSETLVMST